MCGVDDNDDKYDDEYDGNDDEGDDDNKFVDVSAASCHHYEYLDC